MMPDMDGVEVLHRIRQWRSQPGFPCRDTPVVSLTANAVSGARERYLEEGFDDFLSKPIHPENLEKILSEQLPAEKINRQALTTVQKASLSQKVAGEDDLAALACDLPEIDGIDWEYALLHMKNKDILLHTVNDFYHMNESEADQLETFWQQLARTEQTAPDYEEVLKQYRYKVHAMKSSAAMIGAVPISGLARLLEYGARDGKLSLLHRLTGEFLLQWRELKRDLEPMIPREEPGEEKPEGDASLLLEYLSLLERAMEDMDVDTADEIIRQFQRYRYSGEELQVMQSLEQGVANLETDRVLRDCGTMRKLLQI
jgi:HPt (histidine-containing phosphotransfer) domain-containing protein